MGSSETVKVGFLPMYIKLYDDMDPAGRAPREAYAYALADGLAERGLSVIKAPVCRTKEEFDAAAKLFNEADVAAVVTYHLAYSPSLESIEALLSLKAPIVVLDTTPDYELIDVAAEKDCIMDNHGIHGVQDMCNLLKRAGRPYTICAGHALHSDVLDETAKMCRAASAAKAFRTMKVGCVGGTFAGMGDFLISRDRYREEIGAEVFDLTPETVREVEEKLSAEEVAAEMEEDRRRFAVEITSEENYAAATRAGLIVRKWMDENGLDACTVNFLNLGRSGLSKMPFEECCKILARRKGYAGEGDTLTAGLVAALMKISPDTTFAEMFCPDWKEDVILLSHMGESNPRLGSWRPLVTDKKSKYDGGDTVAMYNCYRPGKAVIVNLAPMERGFSLILAPGELLGCGLPDGVYRKATQGWFKPEKPLRRFLREYSEAGGTHHSAMIYDPDPDELRAFGKMMGFEVVEI